MITETKEEDVRKQKKFLALFANTRFRYIHEYNTMKGVMPGTNVLEPELNNRGFGVFFSVNGFPPDGSATEACLISLNANYVDLDLDSDLPHEKKDLLIKETVMAGVESGAPPPTLMVRTKNGAHLYWLYPKPIEPTIFSLEVWRDVQKSLVEYFKGDKAAIDPARVLRVPYTMHLKEPSDPFQVTVMSYKPDAHYSLTELQSALSRVAPSVELEEKTPAIDLLREGVPVGNGQRHAALAQMAGLFLRGADTPEKVAVARKNFYDWDQKVVGSPERFAERKKELDNTFDGILKRELAGKEIDTSRVTKGPPRVWSVGEIMAQDFGEQEWVVRSLIPRGGITVLSGSPGDFKTWITIHTAICVARGSRVFDVFETMKGGVLVIDEEDHIRLLQKRLGFLGAVAEDNISYISQGQIKLDSEESLNAIIDFVRKKNIKLVILDSLVRIHNQDENDAKSMARVFGYIQQIVAVGASILLTHHHRKQIGFAPSNAGQSMRGSSDILAAVDCHISVKKKPDEANRLVIHQSKLRQDEALKPFEVTILKDSVDRDGKPVPSGFEYAGEFDEKKLKTEEAMESVVTILAEGQRSRVELMEALAEEFAKTTSENAIKMAFEKGLIEKIPKEELPKEERKKDFYRLPTEQVNTEVVQDAHGAVSPIQFTQEAVMKEETMEEWFDSLPEGVRDEVQTGAPF